MGVGRSFQHIGISEKYTNTGMKWGDLYIPHFVNLSYCTQLICTDTSNRSDFVSCPVCELACVLRRFLIALP